MVDDDDGGRYDDTTYPLVGVDAPLEGPGVGRNAIGRMTDLPWKLKFQYKSICLSCISDSVVRAVGLL